MLNKALAVMSVEAILAMKSEKTVRA